MASSPGTISSAATPSSHWTDPPKQRKTARGETFRARFLISRLGLCFWGRIGNPVGLRPSLGQLLIEPVLYLLHALFGPGKGLCLHILRKLKAHVLIDPHLNGGIRFARSARPGKPITKGAQAPRIDRCLGKKLYGEKFKLTLHTTPSLIRTPAYQIPRRLSKHTVRPAAASPRVLLYKSMDLAALVRQDGPARIIRNRPIRWLRRPGHVVSFN